MLMLPRSLKAAAPTSFHLVHAAPVYEAVTAVSIFIDTVPLASRDET